MDEKTANGMALSAYLDENKKETIGRANQIQNPTIGYVNIELFSQALFHRLHIELTLPASASSTRDGINTLETDGPIVPIKGSSRAPVL